MIESRTNEHIKNIIKLRDNQKERKKQSMYIVEGPKMVLEAIRLGKAHHVYISKTVYDSISEKEIRSDKAAGNRYAGYAESDVLKMVESTDYDIVSDAVFGVLTDTVTPQGMLALVHMNILDVNDVINSPYGIRHYCNEVCCMNIARLLILCDVQDPGNLGTIMRTAEAAGFNGILMTKGTVSAYNPKVVRSTMGAVLRLPFSYADNISYIIDECKKCGIKVYGAALSGNDFRNIDFEPRSAIIIGNESRGIDEDTLDMCDENIYIPMNPAAESLNAAVAAGIVMYQSSLTFL